MAYKVLNGADRLTDAAPLLKGKRCGLLTAASGVDRKGVPTYVNLSRLYDLTVLFAAEHGIHSVLQDGSWGGEYRDVETGAPVYDLSSSGNPKVEEALSLCDVVVYDVQDVGARFYTYVYCLTYLMSECAARKIPVVILDRPNVLSGDLDAIEGAVLDESRFSSFVGRYGIPTRYSLTCGEFASFINETRRIGCELHVVTCEGWKREAYGDELCLPWINPSPNIPSVSCALNYIGTCLIEATNVSEGRGTTRPFDIVGAPFVDSAKLTETMNSFGLPGVYFSRAFFVPMFGKHAQEVCEGVQFNVTDRRVYRPHSAGVCLLAALRRFGEFEIKERSMALRYGTNALTAFPDFDPLAIVAAEAAGIEEYRRSVEKYLLY